MKLQKNTSIALCSVLEAALNSDRQVSAVEIAQKYGVSLHHLAKVLRQLTRSGLVESTRGVGGGYRFTGNAKRLTLIDIIELFEDVGMNPNEGLAKEDSNGVTRAIAQVLEEIDSTAKAAFRSITIETMLRLIKRDDRQNEG